MESFALFILLIVYVILRAVFGKLKDKTDEDRKKYQPGLELILQRKYHGAIDYFNGVLQKDKRCALAYAMRGKCHLGLGAFSEAITDCNSATSLDHCISDAYLDKGIALYRLKQYSESCLEFDKAVWYGRDKPEGHRWRGLAYFQLGQPDKARSELEKAVRLGDEHANYYLLRKGGNVGREL